MKARVKATGEIVDVDLPYISISNEIIYPEIGSTSYYTQDELDFDIENENIIAYWTRLEHQYAGMAMQGMMNYIEQITPKEGRSYCDEIVDISLEVAHALVKKVRYEENPKELEGLKKELEALKIEKTILENKIKLLKEERK